MKDIGWARWGVRWGCVLGLALGGCHEAGPASATDVASDASATEGDADVASDATAADVASDASATEGDADVASDDDADAPGDAAPDADDGEVATVTDATDDALGDAAVASDATDDAATETDVAPPAWSAVINEIDCRGTPSDWVEIVVTGAVELPLDEVFVTDDPLREDHWQALGSGLVAPGKRVVVDLATFGVACGTEGVSLVREGGAVLDASPPGNDPVGYTWGRLPDATGAFAVTKPTRDAENAPPDLDPFDPIGSLYDPTAPVPTIELTLDTLAWESLANDPYTWVAGTFALTDAHGTVSQAVAMRIKGRYGSLRGLDGKAAFKLQFDRFWPGARFRGVKALTLNNMVQDDAKTHELAAYAFFRAMGVPCPRAGYAWLRVNGQDFGLYADLESYDDPFWEHHFASTKGVFEGAYGDDLFPQAAYHLDLDAGSESARLDLAALVDALWSTPPGDGFMAALAPFVDWDEVLAMMATEVFIGHWDGYAPTRNNYFVHIDGVGRARLVPWGTDQTFGSDLGLYDGQGILLQGCLSDSTCRVAWEDALLALAALAEAGTVMSPLEPVAAIIQPFVDIEPRDGAGVDVAAGLAREAEFLAYRAQEVRDRVGCRRDVDADLDHDGAACDLDCNEGDATIYVGAVDVCGDGIDQDCNGRPDDAIDCPDCSPRDRDGAIYLFCWKSRTRDEANAECASHGKRVVIIDDADEHAWVRDEAAAAGFGAIWIGLSDVASEGVWVWDDGVAMEDRPMFWAGGEPNDWGGGEDCAQLMPWNGDTTWNDIDCQSPQSTVCE